MTRSAIARVLLGLVAALFAVIAVAGPAGAQGSADSIVGAAEVRRAGSCVAPDAFTGSTVTAEAVEADPLLPLNRWGDGATSALHSRLDGGSLGISKLGEQTNRNLSSMAMSLGNSMWRVTGGLTEFATQFEILDQVGCTADRAAAGVGNAMLRGIAPLVVVAGLFALLWRTSQGSEQPGKKAASMVLILGVFAAMLQGARTTENTGAISAPSPAYLATTFNDAINTVAEAPAVALTAPGPSAYGPSGQVVKNDPLHCHNYIAALRQRYLTPDNPNDDAGKSIPLTISAMWEQSGLPSYVAIQFGSNNDYGGRSYCHILERNAGVTAGRQFALVKEGAALADPPGNDLPPGDGSVDGEGEGDGNGPAIELFYGGNNNTVDQAGVWWAACRWDGRGWAVVEGWDDGIRDEDKQVTAAECEDVWKNWGAKESPFQWVASPSDISEKTRAEAGAPVRDFLFSWHGDAIAAPLATSAVYVLTSLIVMCVFGLIAVGIIISKILGVVMIVMIFLMLTIALFPSRGDNNKLAKFVKFWLGMTVFSGTLTLILALVALITAFVNAAGIEAFGQGSFLSILWLGFSPVTAVVLLHMVAKHAIGMPSPFKPSGALAWGAAAGATGAGLGVGLDRLASRGRGYGQALAQGKMARGRRGKDDGNQASTRDQQMPTGGTQSGDQPVNPSSAAPGGSDGDGQATPENPTTPPPPDTRSRRERAGDNARARLADLPGSAAAWARRVPSDMKNWAKAKPFRRVAVPATAFALAGISGAAAVAAAGISGAAAVAAAPAAPLVAGAIGARALWRRRQGAASVLNGRRQNDDGTWETRDEQRERWQRDYQDRQADAATVGNGDTVPAPAEGDGHSHPRSYL